MIFYVTVGGMKGTTWVQIVKAVLLMGGTVLITVLVLAEFGFNLSDLLGAASEKTGKGEAFLQPGLKYGIDTTSKIDFVSLALALVLGTAGLPHILIRFYTVPTAKAARTSVLWAIGLIGTFYLMTLVLGFGAAAMLDTGPESEVATSGGNLASPLLAEAVGGGDGTTGGAVLLALISAVAFATILAVVAGLTLTSASSVAHDLYATVFKRGQASEHDEVRVARIAAFVIGAIAIVLAIPAQKLNIAFLVALAFAVAASANLPSLLYNLFWRRFNTRGAVWAIYGGLITCVVLVFFSPVVSGSPEALVTGSDWAWFPLSNPGIISIPAGFLFGWLGTVTSKEPESEKPLPRARGPFAHRRGLRGRRYITDLDWARSPEATRRQLPRVMVPVRGTSVHVRRQRPGGLLEGRPGADRLVGSTTRPPEDTPADTAHEERLMSDESSGTLANLSTEERRFEPPDDFAENANLTAEAYDEAEDDRLGLLGEAGRASRLGDQSGTRSSTGTTPVREVVRRRQAQRRLQLRRPARRERRRRQGRLPLGRRARGRHPRHHLRRAQGRGVPGRQRADRARRGDR